MEKGDGFYLYPKQGQGMHSKKSHDFEQKKSRCYYMD